jgi:hypothetical protein
MASTTSIGTVLASFKVTQDPNSAWRKLPDWSGSADLASAFANGVGTAVLNNAQNLATLKASQGLTRIRAAAAAKAKAAQDLAAQKLQATIDAMAAKNGTLSPGPKFSTSSTSTAAASSTNVTGPRYSFTV